jgi:hypothetical protein
MVFSLSSYQDRDYTIPEMIEAYSQTQWRVTSSRLDSTSDHTEAIISLRDSTKSAYTVILRNDEYVYQASAVFPNNGIDTTGYYENAQSFINSISLLNTDSYWINQHDQSERTIVHEEIVPFSTSGEFSSYCMTIKAPRQIGFSRGPFLNEHGDLFLAYDFLEHPDSLHLEDLLRLDRDVYTFSPNENGQLFFLPKKAIPNKDFNIDVGYTLLSDSVHRCYEFVFQRHGAMVGTDYPLNLCGR